MQAHHDRGPGLKTRKPIVWNWDVPMVPIGPDLKIGVCFLKRVPLGWDPSRGMFFETGPTTFIIINQEHISSLTMALISIFITWIHQLLPNKGVFFCWML